MRKKHIIIILLPIIIPLWLIGWSLLYIGSKPTKKPTPKPKENNNIKIIIPTYEEITA